MFEMLTPRFELAQDDHFLLVTVRAPYTNVADAEVFMDGSDVRFFSKPYYLRLHLPREVEEREGEASVTYDADQGSFIIRAPKKNRGEHFPGLDMITEFLKPRGEEEIKRPSVQVVSGEEHEANEEEDEEDDLDWYHDQQLPEDEAPNHAGDGYGFAFTEVGVLPGCGKR